MENYNCIPFVSVPYEITLLSNLYVGKMATEKFQYLMKLHYSQTDERDYSQDL